MDGTSWSVDTCSVESLDLFVCFEEGTQAAMEQCGHLLLSPACCKAGGQRQEGPSKSCCPTAFYIGCQVLQITI